MLWIIKSQPKPNAVDVIKPYCYMQVAIDEAGVFLFWQAFWKILLGA